MAATPEAIRIGESFDITALPVDESGKETFVANSSFNPTTSGSEEIIESEQDEIDPRILHVVAIGSGFVTMRYTAVDLFFDDVGPVEMDLRVLDAVTFVFQFGAPSANVQFSVQNGVLVIRVIDDSMIPTISVAAIAVDSRYATEPETMPTYDVVNASILWATSNGKLNFDTGGGSNPTATGTLNVLLVPNEFGEGNILLTATTLAGGNPVSLTFPFRILGRVSVTLSFTQT